MVAKVRERLSVSKQEAQKFEREIFDLRKPNKLEIRKQYQREISNTFAALENLGDSEDINMAWRNIKENIKTSAKESLGLHKLKQHKPWFDEECLDFLDQRMQAKMYWVQDRSQNNIHNPHKIRNEVSRHFRNKMKEYLKGKID